MKRIYALFLALCMFLCSCGVGGGTEAPPVVPDDETTEEYIPDTNVFGVAFAPGESADPYTTSNKLNIELVGLICEPLFALTPEFEAQGVLCTDYTYSNLCYRFTIKSGVVFSDGSALHPSDVEYSLRAAIASDSYYAARLSCISSISSSNRNGYVEVTLKYDNARLPMLLDIPIIKSGTRSDKIPVGSGMYKPNDDMTALVAVENHHSGQVAKYKTIRLCDVSSSDELLFEFDTHNVSVYTNDPTGNMSVAPKSAVDRTNVPSLRFHYIIFNVRNNLLADKNVRRSIARAIDRKSAAENDFALMGRPAALPVHPLSSLYSETAAEALAYDGESRIELSEPLTILVNSENSGKLAVCKRIAETLTRLGAPTTVRALPYAEYTAALARGDFTLCYAETVIGADFDITRLISGSLNYGGFYDGTMTSELHAFLSGDEGRESFCRTFCDLVPIAPVMFKDTAMYTQKNFFEKVTPSSQNVYYGFCGWQVK